MGRREEHWMDAMERHNVEENGGDGGKY